MSSTSAPGKQPISRSFKGIESNDSSEIYPISPFCNVAIVLNEYNLDNKDRNLE